MQVKVVAFGIARDIIKGSQCSIELPGAGNLAELRSVLVGKYPEFDRLKSLRFAVNEEYQNDEFNLSANDEVVIIPPVSGG